MLRHLRNYASRSILLLSLFGAWCSLAHAVQVVPSPIPPFATKSPEFTISVNDQNIPVEHLYDYHVARFSADAAVTLKITAQSPISSYSVHPTHFGLKGTVEGKTLTLSVSPDQFKPQPSYLVIRINKLENLVVLLDPLETGAPKPDLPGVIDVSKAPYSADTSGKDLSTVAIQSAIDKASKSGGTVFVGPGFYRVQSLKLKDNVTLYLADGAFIQGTKYMADVKNDPAFTSKSDFPYVIVAEDFKNIAIKGRGVIDGAGTDVFGADGTPMQVVSGGKFRRGVVRVTNGDGFTVEGVTIRDSTTWTFVTDKVANVAIDRMKIIGPLWSRNDGIDIFSRHAHIDRSFVYIGDDNFCTKALHSGFPMFDVTFSNSIGYGNSAGMKVGLQSESEQYDIHFENMDIIHTGRGAVVERRGNEKEAKPVHDIYFTNVRVEEITGQGGMSRNPIDIDSLLPGTIGNVFFKHASFGNFGPKDSVIQGLTPNSVSNIVFEDVTIGGKAITNVSQGQMDVKNAVDIKFIPAGK